MVGKVWVICDGLGITIVTKQEVSDGCCIQFIRRTKILDWLSNMKGGRTGNILTCRGCLVEEIQAHVFDCITYEDLRKGLELNTDVDLVMSFRNVLVLTFKLIFSALNIIV